MKEALTLALSHRMGEGISIAGLVAKTKRCRRVTALQDLAEVAQPNGWLEGPGVRLSSAAFPPLTLHVSTQT
jgi:hypothetical protein